MRLLIIQNTILHYRKPLYNSLSAYYDVTVIHSGKASAEEQDLYKEIVTDKKKIGSIYFQKKILSEIYNNYQVIIAMCDLHWVNNIAALFLRPKNVKFIWWGAWFTNKYFIDKLKVYLANKADANIFYSNDAKGQFEKAKIVKQKLFVANNTLDLGERVKSYQHPIKNQIMFVGSLDDRKQNDILIRAFYGILSEIDNTINLVIIGSGEKQRLLVNLVHQLGIQNRVCFEGRINDISVLKQYYEKAITSVSFGQAGLSVLQSLGYGVPFVTKYNAISGGEKTNIINNYNGILCDDNIESLQNALLKLCNNLDLARQFGKQAFDYYSEKCTMDNMVEGFNMAINASKI